jgi:hypothetical protein
MSLIGKRRGRPTTRIQFDSILKTFLIFLKRELRITFDIPVVFIDDAEFAKKSYAFGFINPEDKRIYVSIINRHPIDILRTLSHEVVHYKQLTQKNTIKSHAGSAEENFANAKAGEIMRKYGKLHPELFDLMPIR